MPARIKRKTVELPNLAAFQRTIDEIAEIQLKLEADTAVHNEQKAAADKAFKAQLKRDKDKLVSRLAAAEIYANNHRNEILGDRQTGNTKLASFGFRRSPGILKTLNSKWTFARAVETLKEAGKIACIKRTESLDKQAVKKHIPESDLPAFGLRMDHPEEFWIEPKRAEDPGSKRLTTTDS